jgi:hypothetical protein
MEFDIDNYRKIHYGNVSLVSFYKILIDFKFYDGLDMYSRLDNDILPTIYEAL